MKLLNFFKSFLPKPKRIPKKGEIWMLKGYVDGDPFPIRDYFTVGVEILDYKEGWVRYKIGEIFDDERMKLNYFLFCYYPKE